MAFLGKNNLEKNNWEQKKEKKEGERLISRFLETQQSIRSILENIEEAFSCICFQEADETSGDCLKIDQLKQAIQQDFDRFSQLVQEYQESGSEEKLRDVKRTRRSLVEKRNELKKLIGERLKELLDEARENKVRPIEIEIRDDLRAIIRGDLRFFFYNKRKRPDYLLDLLKIIAVIDGNFSFTDNTGDVIAELILPYLESISGCFIIDDSASTIILERLEEVGIDFFVGGAQRIELRELIRVGRDFRVIFVCPRGGFLPDQLQGSLIAPKLGIIGGNAHIQNLKSLALDSLEKVGYEEGGGLFLRLVAEVSLQALKEVRGSLEFDNYTPPEYEEPFLVSAIHIPNLEMVMRDLILWPAEVLDFPDKFFIGGNLVFRGTSPQFSELSQKWEKNGTIRRNKIKKIK